MVGYTTVTRTRHVPRSEGEGCLNLNLPPVCILWASPYVPIRIPTTEPSIHPSTLLTSNVSATHRALLFSIPRLENFQRATPDFFSSTINLFLLDAYFLSRSSLSRKSIEHSAGKFSWKRGQSGVDRIPIYIQGVDKILTRSPRDAAEFHYANSGRELARKESWNNLHPATTRPRATVLLLDPTRQSARRQ